MPYTLGGALLLLLIMRHGKVGDVSHIVLHCPALEDARTEGALTPQPSSVVGLIEKI